MTAPLLVVASSTSQPLCTDVAIPTDGQPQWYRCERPNCLERERERVDGRSWSYRHEGWGKLPDGPFPFPVARWTEVEPPVCEGCPDTPDYPHTHGEVGAIVELVEVTGPSHHADECRREWDSSRDGYHPTRLFAYCTPDAEFGGWHTPTGTVTPLPDLIPCERPVVCGAGWTADECSCGFQDSPASWWFADLDLEVRP